MMMGMTYDTSQLERLGKDYQRKRDAFEKARDLVADEIVAAAAAGVPQRDIVHLTGYTREAIRQLCLTPEQREAEKEKRRTRTRQPASTN
jgi:hypothetical protein